MHCQVPKMQIVLEMEYFYENLNTDRLIKHPLPTYKDSFELKQI